MQGITHRTIGVFVRGREHLFTGTSLRVLLLILATLSLATLTGLFLSSGNRSAAALTTVPSNMNFQGRLTDTAGNIKPNGSYNMKLKLYTVPSAGSAVWSEDRLVSAANGVTVTNGLFSIQLGSTTALPASLFASGSLYVEVELPTPGTATSASPAWTEGPMTPRNQLATSAYAYNSETLDGLDSSDFAAASGGAGYIQNQTASPQAGGFNITGNGTIGGDLSVQNGYTYLSTLDVASGVTVGADLTVAGTLTVSGAATLDDTLSVTNGAYIYGFLNSYQTLTVGAIDATGTLLVLDTKNTAGDPAAITGGMYYNSNTSKYRCYYAAAWSNCNDGGDAATLQGTLASARLSGSYTGLTGTGALATGSIASGFGTISTSNTITGTRFISTVSTGTAPLAITSTTKVTNLNADLLDGLDSTAFGDATAANQTTILNRIGTNADAVGTSTLFARLASIDTSKIGTTADAASSAGSIFARLAYLISSIGATNDAASSTGSVNAKLAYLIGNSSAARNRYFAEFTTSSSWTAPAGVTNIEVFLVGGGGGGGAGDDTGSSYGGGAGGGGGGIIKKIISVTPGNIYTITIGSGGSGGTLGAAGGGGGNTSLGSLTATGGGGGGGSQNASLGPPGVAGPGGGSGGMGGIHYNVSGTIWKVGANNGTPGVDGFGGGGGGGGYAGMQVSSGSGSSGGANGGTSGTAPSAIANSGGGGGGGTANSQSGGAGGSGYVLISWWQ